MKPGNMKYKKILQVSIFSTIIAGNILAQTYSESKHIEKVFKTNPSTTVDINNKYGILHFIPWEKDSVRIEIELSVKSNNLSRLNKTIDNIDFNFTDTDYYIIAKTEFGRRYNNLLYELRNLAETFIPSENNVNIDYTVFIPENINLKIQNKYGDIYIDDHSGDINLILSNGDFKANNLNGQSNIELNMGDGVVNYIKKSKLNISYSDFRIKEAEDLIINTRSSKINIDKSNTVKIYSRRDKYFIERSNNISGETYFSDLWVYELGSNLNLILKYGSLNLEYIDKNFSFLNINSNYADLNLIFEKNAAYQIDITNKNALFSYPEDLAKLEEKAIDDDEKEFIIYGTIGNIDTSSKVKISAIKGNINIIHK
jgi:hypothetical protein